MLVWLIEFVDGRVMDTQASYCFMQYDKNAFLPG